MSDILHAADLMNKRSKSVDPRLLPALNACRVPLGAGEAAHSAIDTCGGARSTLRPTFGALVARDRAALVGEATRVAGLALCQAFDVGIVALEALFAVGVLADV